MNMPVKIADTAAVDARGSRGAKTGSSAGANDDNSTSFDGVLSDVGTDETTSQTAKAETGKAATNDAAGSATTDDPSQVANDSTSLEVLMGFVSQAQTSPAATAMALRGAKTADKPSSGDESVDALLKRIAKKEEDAKDSTDQPATTSSDTDPRLGALATLVAQISPLATGQAGNVPTPGAKSDASRTAQAAALAQQDASSDATSVAAKGTIVSDITVETHLALAPAQADGRAQTTSTALKDETAKTTGSAIAHDAANAATSATTNSGHRGDGAQSDENDKGQQGLAQAESAKTEGLAAAAPMLPADLGSLRRIASAVVELAAAPASNAAVPDADTQPKTTAPARTLTLQMQPADLGTVDVRLHMSSDGLDLQLGVSDERTLGMISRERDTLTTMLQDQNYQVHSLVIQESSGGASSSSSGFGGNQNPAPHSESRADRQFGASNSSDQGTSQRQQQQGDRPAQNGRQSRETSSLRTSADTGNSLFV